MAGKKRLEGRELADYMEAYKCGPPREIGYLEYCQLVLNIDRARLRTAITSGLGTESATNPMLLGFEWADAAATFPEDADDIHDRNTQARLMALAARKKR